jgi:hypothetical protein
MNQDQDPSQAFSVPEAEPTLPTGEIVDPAADLGGIAVRDESTGSEVVAVGVQQAGESEAGQGETAKEATEQRHAQSGAVRAAAMDYGPGKPEYRRP